MLWKKLKLWTEKKSLMLNPYILGEKQTRCFSKRGNFYFAPTQGLKNFETCYIMIMSVVKTDAEPSSA